MNERTTIQPEASSTFKNKYGFVVMTTRDFIRCPRCYYSIFPTSVAGRFDSIVAFPVGYGKLFWGAVEVKNGTKTSLAFDRVDDKQIMWYHKKKDLYSMWLWFNIGERINHKTHPRRTFLIPFSLFLQLKESLDRKSIPVRNEDIKEYELEWSGKGQWVIPDTHALWADIKRFETEGVYVNEIVE